MHMYGVYHCLSPKLEATAKAMTKGNARLKSSNRTHRVHSHHASTTLYCIVSYCIVLYNMVILYTTYFNYSLNRMTQDIISLAQSHDLYVSLACPLWRGVTPKPKDAWSSLWH